MVSSDLIWRWCPHDKTIDNLVAGKKENTHHLIATDNCFKHTMVQFICGVNFFKNMGS
jgi:hypothetical protein